MIGLPCEKAEKMLAFREKYDIITNLDKCPKAFGGPLQSSQGGARSQGLLSGGKQNKEDSAMGNWAKKALVMITVAAMLCTTGAFSAFAVEEQLEQSSGEQMVADLFLVRPVSIVATVFGTACFLVGLPFTATGGNVGESYDKLIAEPAKFTFNRPLGEPLGEVKY
jgi:hypothetical protein